MSYNAFYHGASCTIQLSANIVSITWKDGHSRWLFTIFRQRNSRKEKRFFKWNCRIGGGQICRRETMQYRYNGSGIEYYVLSQYT